MGANLSMSLDHVGNKFPKGDCDCEISMQTGLLMWQTLVEMYIFVCLSTETRACTRASWNVKLKR